MMNNINAKDIINNARKSNSLNPQVEDLPTWDLEMPYFYKTDCANPNLEIQNSRSILNVEVNYSNLQDENSWDFVKEHNVHKQFVRERHTYELSFDKFDEIIHGEHDKDGPSYLCKRNINGTYIKTTETEINVKNSLGNVSVVKFTEKLKGDFKSFDFDFETCNLPNDTLYKKTLCFINEKFINSDNPFFQNEDSEDEPAYILFFKKENCLAHLFASQENINAYKARPNFNNKPDSKWTYFLIQGYRDGVPFYGARAIGMLKTGDDTADLIIDDIRNINKIDAESISRLKFTPNSNEALGSHEHDSVETVYRFESMDPSVEIKGLKDIDCENLQNYSINCVNKEEGSDSLSEKTRCDMIPGFVLNS